jgi:hypothetical protein
MLQKSIIEGLALRIAIAVMAFLLAGVFQGCLRTHAVQFGSHNVTVSRHGVTNRIGIEEHDNIAIFRYSGLNTTGERVDVKIQNEEITLNGHSQGLLRPGDTVRIADEGIAVNSMDFGQTAKYLEANAERGVATSNSKSGS